ncbi:MAG: hypothetical protein K0R54_1859 [Clostridiaceae bacterium]|nr:hypothetical protein [Clostridiaceae bacterium]
MKEVLIVGQHTFEIVDFIPYGYHIWNIGKNMKEDYLPLVQLGGYDGCQVIGIMKALPLKNAQKILSVIGEGNNTPGKMKVCIDKYEVNGINQEKTEKMKEALEIMLKIKGIDNL